MKRIIVIPTYNERANIEKLIPVIFGLGVPNLEIVIVDDNSPDNTAEIVVGFGKILPVHLIKRPEKLGLGSAYIAGFKKALDLGADFIFEMDADFSHDPQDIPRLLDAAQNFDCVIGSRKIAGGKIEGWSAWRKFQSNAAMWCARAILKLKAQDVTAGFRCYQRHVLENLELDSIKSNGYAFQEEMLFRVQQAGFSIKEIPVTFVDRQRGQSKLSKKDIVEFFWVMVRLAKNSKTSVT